MIVDLETRHWSSVEDLGAELSAAVRRVGSGRWVQPDGGLDALAAASRVCTATLVAGFESSLLGGAVDESHLLRTVAHLQGGGFVARAVDPLSVAAPQRVESARKDGFCAIWLDPALQGFNPSDTRAMRVFDRAEACQLPVFIGWSGPMPSSARLEFARPVLLDAIARSFPRLTLVISGFGAPFASETVALLAKHDRVFTTTAGIAARPWELLGALQSCRDYAVEDRVLFASGFPFDFPARAIEGILSVNSMLATTPLPSIPRAFLRQIVERDSVSLLGLGVPPTTPDQLHARALATDHPLGLPGGSE